MEGLTPGNISGNEHARLHLSRDKDRIDEMAFLAEAIEMADEIYKPRTVEAPDRNFRMDVRLVDPKKDIWDIILKGDNGEDISLTELLPKGFAFRPGKEYAASGREKLVSFDPFALDYRESILAIAHEIGHAQIFAGDDYHKTKPKLIDVIKGTLETVKIFSEILKREAQNPSHEQISPRELFKKYDGVIPDWFLEATHKHSSKQERGAWAYGLKLLRNLDEKGFDVFSGFKTADEVISFVTYCLCTYEVQHEISHYFSGNDDSYEPTFEKRYDGIRNRD